MQQSTTMWRTLFLPYLTYLSLFLGMGLISGAIVHMPVDPVRYTIIMVVGAVMFGFASFVNDLAGKDRLTAAIVARSLFFALLLSMGIGMISGGVQHFSDNPGYSASLIPAGFGLSLFAFILKNEVKLSVKRIYGIVLIFLALAVPLKFTLDYVAHNIVGESDSHGHGH
ncbi:MAG: hypothetical protein ACOY94_19030 [Bacillota bacterium]